MNSKGRGGVVFLCGGTVKKNEARSRNGAGEREWDEGLSSHGFLGDRLDLKNLLLVSL